MVPDLEMLLLGCKPRPRDAPLLTIIVTPDATVESGPPRVTSSRYPRAKLLASDFKSG